MTPAWLRSCPWSRFCALLFGLSPSSWWTTFCQRRPLNEREALAYAAWFDALDGEA